MSEIPVALVEALADRYRVERQLGEGGMAQVYLAQDLRHDREVALKVLRRELSEVLGEERFSREIKTTAGLQHPNILPLHDSGTAAGSLFYVMPLVRGESLRERLDREIQLGVKEAIRIAGDLADALDYAHREGVVHRDIKPENILLQDGRPLLADFGIALALHEAGGGRLTETGLSLGTPLYMSPEQITGDRNVTHRADIYALGAVLYEMLAGEPPYRGGTAQAVMAKVLTHAPPDLADVRPSVPPHVAATVMKALSKLPADRFEDAGSFAEAVRGERQVESVVTTGPQTTTGALASSPRRGVRTLVTAVAFLVLGGAAGWLLRSPESPTPERTTRFTILVPQGLLMDRSRPGFAVSPDGSKLTYVVRDSVFLRSMDSFEPTFLGSLPGFCCPVFTEDGRWIYSAESLEDGGRGISVDGGPFVDLTAVLERQDLVYGSIRWSGVGLKRAGESAWTQVTSLDTLAGEAAHLWPQLLPGGKAVLYTALPPSYMWNGAKVVFQDIATGERTTVAEGVTFGRYLPTGHVAYIDEEGTLQAVPFDLEEGSVRGAPFVVASGVRTAYWAGGASVAISEEGTLAFVRGSSWGNQRLTWADRGGRVLGTLGDPRTVEGIRLSPDGRQAATYVASPNADISVFDVATGEERRLTFNPGIDDNPVWSGDGRRIAYHQVTLGSDHRIYEIDVSERREPRLLTSGSGYIAPRSWSADGRALLMWASGALLALDIEAQRIDTVSTTTATEGGRFSPDGRWIAYTSDETGRLEVYVVSYPGLDRRQQVSVNGGRRPEWSRDSGELFFTNGDTLMVSAVTTTPDFERSVPRSLFVSPDLTEGLWFSVTNDGQRFLYTAPNPDAPEREIHVVKNWFTELEEQERQ